MNFIQSNKKELQIIAFLGAFLGTILSWTVNDNFITAFFQGVFGNWLYVAYWIMKYGG